jgi:hypothetical protein
MSTKYIENIDSHLLVDATYQTDRRSLPEKYGTKEKMASIERNQYFRMASRTNQKSVSIDSILEQSARPDWIVAIKLRLELFDFGRSVPT